MQKEYFTVTIFFGATFPVADLTFVCRMTRKYISSVELQKPKINLSSNGLTRNLKI